MYELPGGQLLLLPRRAWIHGPDALGHRNPRIVSAALTRAGVLARIYQVAQFFAGLEVGNTFGRNLNLGSRLWIASYARLALTDPEASESPNLDLVSRLERADHRVEDGVDNHLAVAPGKIANLRDFLNQFCFCHRERAPDSGYSFLRQLTSFFECRCDNFLW